jgi:hypothetical protein
MVLVVFVLLNHCLLCVVLWTLMCVFVHFRLEIELSVRSESEIASVFLMVMYDCGMYVERDADLIYPKGILKQSKCWFVILAFQRLIRPTS